MLTGIFKDKRNSRLGPPRTPQLALGRLLQAKSLGGAQFLPRATIRPFQVDFVCQDRALIVELVDAVQLQYGEAHAEARTRFLVELGYRVVPVSRKEVLRLPDKVVARVRHALEEARSRPAPTSVVWP